MAGLLAARALADHFDRVTLVERDRLPEGPAFRAGVPQSRHLHALLARGLEVLEELFPGYGGELRAAGAVPVRWPRDVLWLSPGGWSRRFEGGLTLLSASRELFEWGIRRRLFALPNVRPLDGHEVTGLVGAQATGRSRACGCGVGNRAAAAPRGPVLLPTEGDRWIVTLAGYGDPHRPPTDDAGFASFAAGLRSPLLHDTLADATPLSPIRGYARTENQWRHYERLARRPGRFLVTGDAACAFNPVYGQGMTAAALAAQTLSGCLRELRGGGGGPLAPTTLDGLASAFQRRNARASGAIWLLATGEDLRYPATVGARPAVARFVGLPARVLPVPPLASCSVVRRHPRPHARSAGRAAEPDGHPPPGGWGGVAHPRPADGDDVVGCVFEAFYLLEDTGRPAQEALLDLVVRGRITAHDVEGPARVQDLLHKYADRPMDLADATLVALAEQLRSYRVFTLDRASFSVYRAHGRRAFELVPPRLD